jgi:hypothetical protein
VAYMSFFINNLSTNQIYLIFKFGFIGKISYICSIEIESGKNVWPTKSPLRRTLSLRDDFV